VLLFPRGSSAFAPAHVAHGLAAQFSVDPIGLASGLPRSHCCFVCEVPLPRMVAAVELQAAMHRGPLQPRRAARRYLRVLARQYFCSPRVFFVAG
jgi:hypothetical protein